MMSALASVIDSDDPDEIDRIIREGIPDPVGHLLPLQPGRAACCGAASSSGNGNGRERAGNA